MRSARKALLQLSTAIPVFVLTRRGLDFTVGYVEDPRSIRDLSSGKQYLISGKCEGRKLKIGNFHSYLSEATLPVRSEKEPRPFV